jgi:sugar/nucleoside kinase (ribokinase family)
MPKDLVVLGNLLVDDVVLCDGSTRMAEPGGAAMYAALGARLWGVDVGVCSVKGSDYPPAALEAMAARGIDLAGVHALERPGIRIWLLYEERGRQFVHRRGRPSHLAVSPDASSLPGTWRTSRAFHVSPMPFARQRELVAELAAVPGAFVSLDPLAPVTPETLGDWRELAAKVDAFFVGEDELTVDTEHLSLLRQLAGGRLRHVVLKRSSRGGELYDVAADRVVPWVARAEAVVDPTGAGDAFAAGMVAGLLRGESVERALRRGLVSASFALQGFGPAALLSATPGEAEARLREWFGR